MNHNIPNLQIHIHKVDGSIATFVQNDAGEVKKLLDGFQPTQVFNRDRIAFTDKHSITSLPVSKITRIDLESEQHSHLLFPIGMVNAVELTGTEFEALIRNPVMREQWDQISTQDASLVTFLDVEMADGQCLFLTVEMQVELQSELWKTKGFPLSGSGFCFRMRTGGVAVLNLAHLTRLTFFPKPLHTLADNWHAQQFHSQSPTKQINGNHSGASVVVNPPKTPPPLTPLFLRDKRINVQRK
jgi:hypothetical protein